MAQVVEILPFGWQGPVYTMVIHDQVMPGAKPSAAMVLTL